MIVDPMYSFAPTSLSHQLSLVHDFDCDDVSIFDFVEEDYQPILAWLADRPLSVLESEVEVAALPVVHSEDRSGKPHLVPLLDPGEYLPQVKVKDCLARRVLPYLRFFLLSLIKKAVLIKHPRAPSEDW